MLNASLDNFRSSVDGYEPRHRFHTIRKGRSLRFERRYMRFLAYSERTYTRSIFPLGWEKGRIIEKLYQFPFRVTYVDEIQFFVVQPATRKFMINVKLVDRYDRVIT